MKVLIAGDNLMDPALFREAYEGKIPGLEIRTVKFDFPGRGFPLLDDTVVPSGMSWQDPRDSRVYEGVREYYGDPLALIDEIGDTEVLVIHGAALPKKVIEKAKSLKYVIALRGGPVNIDVACLKARGIALLNTSGKNAQAVAEFLMGQLLCFERGIEQGHAALREGYWQTQVINFNRAGFELKNKTFGLIGYGRVARCLRHILLGFDARVIAYDPFVPAEDFKQDEIQSVDLETLMRTAQYISLHARQPKGGTLVDERLISLMRKDTVLINTARGSLLDYRALETALKTGMIRGAVLDVYGSEPYSFYRELVRMDNVIATPHIAGATKETVLRAVEMSAEHLKSVVKS